MTKAMENALEDLARALDKLCDKKGERSWD